MPRAWVLFPPARQGTEPVPLYLPLCWSISHRAGQCRASPVAATSHIVQLGSGCVGPPHLPPVPQPARGCRRCSERSWQRCSRKLCILVPRPAGILLCPARRTGAGGMRAAARGRESRGRHGLSLQASSERSRWVWRYVLSRGSCPASPWCWELDVAL